MRAVFPAGAPAGLAEAVLGYERALMDDDLALMDALFVDSTTTLRGDGAGLLVGHDAISSFRGRRGGAPRRTVADVHVQAIDDDHALVVVVTEFARGGRGQTTQLWVRSADSSLGIGGWRVSAAHVTAPAPALDTRIWRLVGDPLLRGSGDGPLSGESVAVKDLYAVAGHAIGAGNPAWLAQAPVESEHAPVVARLLDAGADVLGIARTDEFAYSLAGVNIHHGTPPNPAAPGRIPGGSSSGSASAVALGQASIGLGTDTAGSIRIPASYQGLWGIRTSHGLLPLDHVHPLAPSFDTVGWLTRDAALLERVGATLLPAAAPQPFDGLVLPADMLGLAEPEVAEQVTRWLRSVEQAPLGPSVETVAWPFPTYLVWCDAFARLRSWEAWQADGEWASGHWDDLDPVIAARFEHDSHVTAEQAEHARVVVAEAREAIREFLGNRVLVQPSASSVAPPPADVAVAREANLRLTSLAGLAGLPVVSLPLRTEAGLPCGVALVGGAGRDRDLLALARELA